MLPVVRHCGIKPSENIKVGLGADYNTLCIIIIPLCKELHSDKVLAPNCFQRIVPD